MPELTSDPTLEIKEETPTLESDEPTTVEGEPADPEGGEPGDENPTGDSFYQEQLKAMEEENNRLKEEAAEREKQIEIKNRAIQAMKKKPEAKSTDHDSLKQELLAEMRAEISRKEAQQFIETVTGDKAEREVFLRHYEKFPKSGNVQNDVLGAIATANAPRILELLGRNRTDEANEDRVISSMSGGGVRSAQPRAKTALRKEVEKLLPPEAKKYLDKHVPR